MQLYVCRRICCQTEWSHFLVIQSPECPWLSAPITKKLPVPPVPSQSQPIRPYHSLRRIILKNFHYTKKNHKIFHIIIKIFVENSSCLHKDYEDFKKIKEDYKIMLYVCPKPIITVYTNIIFCLWPIRGIPHSILAHIPTQMYIIKDVHIFDQCLHVYTKTIILFYKIPIITWMKWSCDAAEWW